MTPKLLGLVVAAIASTGCRPHSAELSVEEQLNMFCQYVGNSKDRQYCKTTFIQVLANPRLFDTRRIMLRGWVMEMNGILAIFPTKESIEGGELNSSIIIRSGSKRDELLALLQRDQIIKPRMLTVAGEFRVRKAIATSEEDSSIRYRFGGLYDVDEFEP